MITTIQRTGRMDMDICQCDDIIHRVRSDARYAQNLYAALCNTEWVYDDVFEVLRGNNWRCSWRSAGGIIADIRGEGDYMDWYCSGMIAGHPDDDLDPDPAQGHVAEGTVTDQIRQDLLAIGWRQAG